MREQNATLLSAGVDWITCTAKREGNAKRLQSLAEKLLFQEQLSGCEMKERSIEGYRMLSCGAVAGGTRHDGIMLRLSSHAAAEHWYPALAAADNVSRLDLQTTIRYSPARPNLATQFEAHARKYKREHNHKTQIELRRNDVKGSTLYTGQRTSYRFGRVYDKFRESKDEYYRDCWRAEVELHKKEAKYMSRELLQDKNATLKKVDYVSRYFSRLGILLPKFDPTLTCAYQRRDYVDPTLARTLTWYRTQVQPSLRLTVACAGLGVVLEALGLDDLVTVREHSKAEKGES